MIVSHQNFQRDQIPQLLDQHLLTDAAYASANFGKARRPALDMVQYQRLPFTTDHHQRDIQSAGRVRSVHVKLTLTFW